MGIHEKQPGGHVEEVEALLRAVLGESAGRWRRRPDMRRDVLEHGHRGRQRIALRLARLILGVDPDDVVASNPSAVGARLVSRRAFMRRWSFCSA